MDGIRLRIEAWEVIWESCLRVRQEVFVTELGMPPGFGHDVDDSRYLHVLALTADGTAVGTGRLSDDGYIQHLAVRGAWRERGIGGAILGLLIEEAREHKHAEVLLNAQLNALPFFRSFDSAFEEVGPRFVDAGLEHQALRLRLQP